MLKRTKEKKLNLSKAEMEFDAVADNENDFSSPPQGLHQKIRIPLRKINLVLPVIFILISFAIILGRVVYLQTRGNAYKALSEKVRSQIEWIIPYRGIIYDRNKTQLVYNIPAYDLLLSPIKFKNFKKDHQETLQEIAELINIPKEDISAKIQSNRNQVPITLKGGLSPQEALSLKSQMAKWPFLSLRLQEKREYLAPLAFAHVLGYMGRVNAIELSKKSDYLKNDFIGKNGIEIEYESLLRGKIGRRSFEVNPLQKPVRPLSEEAPQNGANIMLTIDAALQEKLYQTLKTTLVKNNLTAGAAVAMDPQDGAILALVSLPSFDSNKLSQGKLTSQELSSLLQSKHSPFLDRVTSGTYPPGSTFKPVVALAALQEKIISPKKTFNCLGYLRVPSAYNPKVSYLFRDWKAHDITDMRKAIAQSCDVYFYIIGGGYQQFKGLGINKLKYYATKFGFGKKTNVDLPMESSGLIPDPTWKKKVTGEKWYIGDTYHASIGQGSISVTPLQLAQFYSYIANGGTIYKPHLLKAIQETEKGIFNQIKPEIQPFNPNISKDNIRIVKEGLRQAVLSGTCQLLKNLPVSSAAKTGTAQFGDGSKSHAWFVAFAPYDKPEIVLVVLAEAGGEGSRVAMPVADEVLKWYFSKSGKTESSKGQTPKF